MFQSQQIIIMEAFMDQEVVWYCNTNKTLNFIHSYTIMV
jgi:hypothetical protein